MIIDHNNKLYRIKWDRCGRNRFNGAFYYSKEIVENIIPRIKTDRSWITVNVPPRGCDHAIVFVHNNMHPEHYDWLSKYSDLILVCGVPETVDKVKHLGHAIYLPLSIDLDYVKQFETVKDRDTAYVGRPAKRKMDGVEIPSDVDIIEGIRRQEMLSQMARYRKVMAVGRTAIEAKALGCDVIAYDPRYPDPDVWQVLDNADAARMLQEKIDAIDHPEAVRLDMTWTKADLIKYADDHGKAVTSRMTKAKILEVISND